MKKIARLVLLLAMIGAPAACDGLSFTTPSTPSTSESLLPPPIPEEPYSNPTSEPDSTAGRDENGGPFGSGT